MSHATLEDLHDIAWGFAPEDEHVAGCPNCARTLADLGAERDFFRSALDAPPRAGRWTRAVPLAAAAALVAALAWALVTRPNLQPAVSGTFAQESPKKMDLGRLVAEFRGSNDLRKRIALRALRAYGGAAVPALRRAGEDKIADELSGEGGNDELSKKLRHTKIDMSFEDSNLEDIIAFLRDFTNINFILEAGIADKKITIKVASLSIEHTLKLLVSQYELHFHVRDGAVIILKGVPPPAEGYVPVRLAAPDADRRALPGLVQELGEDSLDRRDAAEQRLARLGFAAEEALWSGLDSKNDEVRTRCGALLEKLYERRTELPLVPDPAEAALRAKTLDIDYADEPAPTLLRAVSEAAGVPVVADRSLGDVRITLRVRQLPGLGCLKLALQPHGYECHVADGAVVVVRADRRVVRTRIAAAPTLWATPKRAAEIEKVLADPKSARPEDAPILRWAGKDVSPARDVWFPDEPSPIRAIPDREIDARFEDAPLADVLAAIGKAAGVTIEGKGDERFWIYGKISARRLLELVTRPYGRAPVEKDGKIRIE